MSEIAEQRARGRAPVGQPEQRQALLFRSLTLGGRWRAFLIRLQTRRSLLRLTDQQLRDIGLSREAAIDEAELPFWRLWK